MSRMLGTPQVQRFFRIHQILLVNQKNGITKKRLEQLLGEEFECSKSLIEKDVREMCDRFDVQIRRVKEPWKHGGHTVYYLETSDDEFDKRMCQYFRGLGISE